MMNGKSKASPSLVVDIEDGGGSKSKGGGDDAGSYDSRAAYADWMQAMKDGDEDAAFDAFKTLQAMCDEDAQGGEYGGGGEGSKEE